MMPPRRSEASEPHWGPTFLATGGPVRGLSGPPPSNPREGATDRSPIGTREGRDAGGYSPSALGLLDGRGQGAEDREHGVEVGQAGAETIDEVGQGELAVEQVLVVLADVVGQLAHQRGVDLFE